MKVASISVVLAAIGLVGLLIGAFDNDPKWMISGAILTGACLVAWSIQNKTVV
jgi:hypothetical protein